MLHERYICSLPRVKKDKSDITDRSPSTPTLAVVYMKMKILGWEQQRPKGHPKCFSPGVYGALREEIFTFSKIEYEEEDGLSIETDAGLGSQLGSAH
jgi:hypothetical protein